MRNHKCGCNSQNCNSCNPCNNKKAKPACCAANIPDSFFTNFLAVLDACNVGPDDPFNAFFAPDVLALIALIAPTTTECEFANQLYGLDAVLENRADFCGNFISVQHTLTNLQRFTFGPCDLLAVMSTDIRFEIAPGFGISGTQEIKTKFNEQCKIDTFVINTSAIFGPLPPAPGTAPTLARTAAPTALPADLQERVARAARTLGRRLKSV